MVPLSPVIRQELTVQALRALPREKHGRADLGHTERKTALSENIRNNVVAVVRFAYHCCRPTGNCVCDSTRRVRISQAAIEISILSQSMHLRHKRNNPSLHLQISKGNGLGDVVAKANFRVVTPPYCHGLVHIQPGVALARRSGSYRQGTSYRSPVQIDPTLPFRASPFCPARPSSRPSFFFLGCSCFLSICRIRLLIAPPSFSRAPSRPSLTFTLIPLAWQTTDDKSRRPLLRFRWS